jgi:hypothetical protein
MCRQTFTFCCNRPSQNKALLKKVFPWSDDGDATVNADVTLPIIC